MASFSEPAVQPIAEVQTETLDEVPETIPEKNYENLKKIKDSALTSKTFIVFTGGISLIVLLLVFLGLYRLYINRKDRGYIVSAPPKETLETPKDFNTAINLFLGKTDE